MSMACAEWVDKLDAYVDGELTATDELRLREHLLTCAACAAESLSRVQEKHMVRVAAAARFAPDAAFRARVQKSLARRPSILGRVWVPALVSVVILIAAASLLFVNSRRRGAEQALLSELVDVHVATIGSVNPVDVISSDRHTVKPWFAGKIPFTFNLPELQATPFTLVGGRVSYLRQSPGAELIFRVRQHEISVFIFQEKDLSGASEAHLIRNAQSFNVRSWSRDGLVYFAVSDVNGADLDALRELMKNAG
jgi:anti-sigma factor RsiW